MRNSRRNFIAAGTSLAVGLTFAGMHRPHAQTLDPTPACHDGDEPTLPQIEGPYFKPNSPERSDLVEEGINGEVLELAGFVLTRGCKPVGRALIDAWQANAAGSYDNVSYRLRGHQFTDADGRFRLRTILPGLYEGRTRHIHCKVQAPGGRILTTQLYFPGESWNRRDRLFRQELLIRIVKANSALEGRFDFVLNMR